MPTDEENGQNVVERLLNDQSYHIEFNVYLTNNVKHAVIALKGLGASPQRIKDYYDSYASCTTYGYGLEPQRLSEQTITQDNWQAYFGKHCSFTPTASSLTSRRSNLGCSGCWENTCPACCQVAWARSCTAPYIWVGHWTPATAG